ncbi:hypothetical protein GCM10027090_02540 [Sinomonas soli]
MLSEVLSAALLTVELLESAAGPGLSTPAQAATVAARKTAASSSEVPRAASLFLLGLFLLGLFSLSAPFMMLLPRGRGPTDSVAPSLATFDRCDRGLKPSS